SKAGEDKQPIILSAQDNISDDIYKWIEEQGVKDAYFIGGTSALSNNIINRVNTITSNNVLNNRVSGSDRQETNAKVIEKFYTSEKYSSVLITKHDPLVDALAAGPLAAAKKSPIVIIGNTVSRGQIEILNKKTTDVIYEVGGGINQSSFNKIVDLLK
ncbi:MAG: cell wall-binding repeat-containing protein, partial [Romboutsia sp.]